MKVSEIKSNGAQAVQWYESGLKEIDGLKKCPFPDSCKVPSFDISENGIRPSRTFDRKHKCPLYSESCNLGTQRKSKYIDRLCNHIRQVEYVDDLKQPKKTKSIEYVNDKLSNGRCVLLSGPTGRGKDFAIANWLLQDRPKLDRVYWFTARSLIGIISDNSKVYKRLMSATKPIVIVQDLGMEPPNMPYGQGPSSMAIVDLFDHVHGCGGTILGSTNLDAAKLKTNYGERFVSRINGWNGYAVVGSDEKDLRLL